MQTGEHGSERKRSPGGRSRLIGLRSRALRFARVRIGVCDKSATGRVARALRILGLAHAHDPFCGWPDDWWTGP